MDLFPTILPWRILFLVAAWIVIQANAGQIPLQDDGFGFIKGPTKEDTSWSFFEKPSDDSTSHLIFDTVNSFLQHWPNTRYRNGHSIVPGTIPIGTLLYHGTRKEEIPRTPEWSATDPEHSYVFCFNTTGASGCWHLTLVATRPLRVLYFDGSSAAKVHGAMDSQDVLVWGEVRPDRLLEERKRIRDLCDWGKQYGIDGFVRMEMDLPKSLRHAVSKKTSEVMLCDFTAGVEVVSFLNLVPSDVPTARKDTDGTAKDQPYPRPLNIVRPIESSTGFRAVEAGSWHNFFPGETRIHLNYAGVVSFYDTALFPSLKPLRSEKERWDHRLEGIASEDAETLLQTLGSILDGAWDLPASGIDWKTFLRVVVDRYVDRLQVLNHLLNSTMLESKADVTLALVKAHGHMSGMISPYRLYSASPPSEVHSTLNLSWAIPVFRECATTHTRYIDSNPSLSQNLTYSERLLLDSTKLVSKEICRVIVRMWAEGMEHAVSNGSFTCSAQKLMTHWKGLTEGLMAWLDWSEWITCRPACGDEEICYLPTWPFLDFTGTPGHSRFHHLDPPSLSSKSDGFDDSDRPQPRCLRRIEPVPT